MTFRFDKEHEVAVLEKTEEIRVAILRHNFRVSEELFVVASYASYEVVCDSVFDNVILRHDGKELANGTRVECLGLLLTLVGVEKLNEVKIHD